MTIYLFSLCQTQYEGLVVPVHLYSYPDLTKTTGGSSSTSDLPKSVKNAPPELRRAIRRNQNNESAKRSRQKKREEDEIMQQQFLENKKRIEYLEKHIDELSTIISNKKKNKESKEDPDTKRPYYGHPKDKKFYGDPF